MDRILTTEQVVSVFVRRMDGASLRTIADEMEISRQYALNILDRTAYKDVQVPDYLVNIALDHMPLKRAKTSKRNRKILQLYEEGYAQVEIARMLDCGTATVCREVNKAK